MAIVIVEGEATIGEVSEQGDGLGEGWEVEEDVIVAENLVSRPRVLELGEVLVHAELSVRVLEEVPVGSKHGVNMLETCNIRYLEWLYYLHVSIYQESRSSN